MALSHKARRRWALVVLLLGLPLYIFVASSIVTWFGRPPVWLELLIYLLLGVIWALPFRKLFLGVGQPDPDDDTRP